MKLFIFIFWLFLIPNLALSQAVKDTVYVRFDTTSTKTCGIDVEGKGYQRLPKYRKEKLLGITVFKICRQNFGFENKSGSKDTLSKAEAGELVYSNIDYLVQQYKKAEPRKFKYHVFKQIYIVEKLSDQKYVKYEVGWMDEDLGWTD